MVPGKGGVRRDTPFKGTRLARQVQKEALGKLNDRHDEIKCSTVGRTKGLI